MYEALQQLDPIKINFSASGMHAINIILSFIMFGVALGIKPTEFKELIKHPKSTLVGLLSQVFALPLTTFLLVILLSNQITPTVAMGMILVASCPAGNISNFMTSLSKANTEPVSYAHLDVYKRQVAKGSEGQYGSVFWLDMSNDYPEIPKDLLMCGGHDSQYIYIIPSLELVVVRTGFSKKEDFNYQQFLASIVKCIK